MNSTFLNFFTVPFFISLLLTSLVVLFPKLHIKWSGDTTEGPQKIQKGTIPRIGGGMIFLAFIASTYYFKSDFTAFSIRLLAVASLPVFLGGILEDFTKRVSATSRLTLSFSSAIIGYFLIKAGIFRTGFDFLDNILITYPEISILFTIIAVGGLCHSINIIDGMNGIMLGYIIITFVFLAEVAQHVNNPQLAEVCYILIGASIGMLVFNFPFGKIFTGDGGSYFLGFVIAEMSIILVRNSMNIAAFFPVTLFFYPIIETLFSMGRRAWKRNNPMTPDSKHLHSLLYKLIKRKLPNLRPCFQNSSVAPLIWLWNIANGLILLEFINSDKALILIFLINLGAYLGIYWLLNRAVGEDAGKSGGAT